MFFSNNVISRKMVFLWLILISTTVISSELVQRNSKAEREKAAQQVTQQFVKKLGGHLKKEMQTNGPVAAIKVCKEVAPKLANELSIENGWRITRVTSKPRNALLGLADEWESQTLVAFELRAGKGEKYSDMAQAEIVEEAGASYYRYMKPLVVKPICLTCHGSNEQIPISVKAALDVAYPFDQARNYKVGQLRGAVSIKQAMIIPLVKTSK